MSNVGKHDFQQNRRRVAILDWPF